MIIYKITNLINGKIYIGKQVRIRKNDNYWGSGVIIKKAIKKYSVENFKKEILEKCNNKIELREKEIYWIKKLNSTNKDIGYNITGGGEKCDNQSARKYTPLSKKTKNKISRAKTGTHWGHHSEETKKKMSEIRMGMQFTDEHKKNLSIARKKRIITEETKEKLRQSMIGKNVGKYVKVHSFVDEEENIYKSTEGLVKFARLRGIGINTIKSLIKDKGKIHKGLRCIK